jgi:SAM-dependent methyltransferase
MATEASSMSLTRAPGDDWIAAHRAVWNRKPGLRRVYGRWFKALRDACVPNRSIVEIGCGPGFFKELYPEVLATDVVPNPHADRIVDGTTLPFSDDEVGNVVLLDVFHHLPDPRQFLREVARVLRPGGRLVMIEPWVGLAGRLLFRYVHHEECDLSVDPATPWDATEKRDPMTGNAALPYLYFRPHGYLERMQLPLRVVRCERFAAVPWILSGGFQPFGLLPAWLVPVVEALDRLLSLVPSLTATRSRLVVEKTA